MESIFRLEHISKRYGEVSALEDVSLSFSAGTVSALVGSSGSGKSTLLRLLLGLQWPDRGRILVEGQLLEPATRLAIRRRIGYVIQEGGLFPHLTVRNNLALLPRHLGWGATRIDARAHELAALMALPESVLVRYPTELSGGQRQRVALMRALMTDPPALLMDEPLGALDPLVRAELQERLQQLFVRLRKTVLLVTHDLTEASFLASRIILIRARGSLRTAAHANCMSSRPMSSCVASSRLSARGRSRERQRDAGPRDARRPAPHRWPYSRLPLERACLDGPRGGGGSTRLGRRAATASNRTHRRVQELHRVGDPGRSAATRDGSA
jgi:osmoprotectant transport system ATP-binding protein